MKLGIRHDINRRKKIDDMRIEWVRSKSVYRNKLASQIERDEAKTKRVDIAKKYGSSSIVVNYCVKTGETRSVITKFARNRHIVRDMARRGKLPGVIKASW